MNSVKEVLDSVITSEYYTNEEKIGITHKLLDAIAAEDLPIYDDMFVRVSNTDDPEKMSIDLFYHKKDEDGNISFKNLNADKDQIIGVLYKDYVRQMEKGKKL